MSTLSIVLPVFMVIGVGYVLRLLNVLKSDAHAAFSKLVFYIAAPALLVRSIARTPLAESLDLRIFLVVAALTVLVALAGYLVTYRALPARRGILAQGMHRSNQVFVGLPIIDNALGESALGPAAVLISFMVLLYNFLAVLLLTLPHQGRTPSRSRLLRTTLHGLARNPLLLGSAVGILLSAFSVPLPLSVERTLHLIGRIALPLALLTVGLSLDFARLRCDLRAATLVAIVKLILYPALIYTGLRLVGVSGNALAIPVLLMAAPTAVVSSIMAREMDGDERLAGAIVIGTTVASLFTISAWLVFLR